MWTPKASRDLEGWRTQMEAVRLGLGNRGGGKGDQRHCLLKAIL
jgi:hypothetical protein